MKSTTFIAILLTLLSLLLIAGAASFFLLQGRQDLLDEAARLEEEVQSQTLTANQLQTTVDAQDMALATNEAAQSQTLLQLATRDAQLAQSEATLEALEATRAAQPATTAGPPMLDIVSPQFGASVASDAALPIVVVAFAGEGITRIDILVGDRQQALSETGNGDPYRVMRRSVFNLTPGRLMITATLTTEDNQIQQNAVEIFVSNATPQNGEDTQGLLSAPLADLRR